MTFSSIQNGFSAGEMSPRLFGRTDLQKYALGCSTLRNFYCDYRGGASTRAGLAYVGMCKQGAPNEGGTTTDNPPRDIPFQFNINQGYALEFGDQYMRIKSEGAYVVENSVSVTSATNANPAVFTSAAHGFEDGDWLYGTGFPGVLNNIIYATGLSADSITIVDNGVISSVAVGDGPEGVCVSPDGNTLYVANSSDDTVSVISVQTRAIIATVSVGSSPNGIAITPNGTEVYVANFDSDNVSVISTVSNTVTHTITVGNGANGVAVTPSGTKVYVSNFFGGTVTPITVSTHTAGSAIAVGSGPGGIATNPVFNYLYVANFGSDDVYIIETAGDTVSASVTVGDGPEGLAVTPDGAYLYIANYNAGTVSVIEVDPSHTVIDTIAVNAQPWGVAVSSDSANVYVNSQVASTVSTIDVASNTVIATTPVGSTPFGVQSLAIYSQETSNGGFATLNGLSWIVVNKTANTFELTDLFGNAVDSSDWNIYSSGGEFSRIYTVVSPYAAIDLPFLKFTQSADTMTLTCVNQETSTEYPSYGLVRNGATNWVFTEDTFESSIDAPSGITVVANSSTTLSTYYSYVVTAVDSETGEESIASSVGSVQNNDISINAGSNVITWSPVTGASSYNVYGSTPSYGTSVPVGASFGYIGTASGTQFVDTNIVADFTTVPPVHNDPFAPGKITGVTPTAGGTSYTQSNVTYNITTSTGSGAVIIPVVVNGAVVAYIIQNGGEEYAQGDTITITSSGAGSGATATLSVGPSSGTYPGVCAYYQQRRGYGFTLNEPDTYFFSQPGAFNNFDSAIPTVDSDAIIGSPWAQQINGIQFMLPMNPGLIILTGGGAWLLNGGDVSAFTPSTQTAQAQAYNGCHSHIAPIVVNLDILYIQAKGSIVRDLSFNFFQNIFTGTDMTVLSEHLFNFHQIQDWAYAEEPFKIVWCTRDDGIMLSFTYLKEQDVYGWARHDTNGLFMGVCSVIEPPVDAIYLITRRYIAGEGVWVYYSERMDNRNWQTLEECFCVDSGLTLPMSFPDAVLTPSAADGTDNISSINIIDGGTGYTSPVVSAVDPTGRGSGFSATLSVTGGVITGYTIVTEGEDYQPGTELQVSDNDGTGAVLAPLITNIVNFSASASVFLSGMEGDVIRIGNNSASSAVQYGTTPSGGGKAVITSVFSSTNIAADIIEPITNIVTDDSNETPVPVQSGYWSLSTPVSAVSGLNHLEGMEVVCLADGNAIPAQTVEDGSITLPDEYSSVIVGLPFTAQLQTLYLDVPSPVTMQGKRKNLQAVTARVENTRGIAVGTNQPDASTQPNQRAPEWRGLYEMKQRNSAQGLDTPTPLYTGDLRELVSGSWQKPGQIAVEQSYPLPANVLALIPEFQIGDNPG